MTTAQNVESPKDGGSKGLDEAAAERVSYHTHPTAGSQADCLCVNTCPNCNCMTATNDRHLLTKPLRDGLVGLQRRIDRLDDTKIIQSITDCIQFVLIETPRINSEVN